MTESKRIDPIYVVGPTATGKSDFAVRLAKELDGVVISADSMQIYRGLNIGTAKVSEEEMRGVEHKLINIVDADEEFSVAEFAQLAKCEIQKAQNAGKVPIVVGGTGLYFEALIYPMSFANTVKNEALRNYLADFLKFNGADALLETLKFFDSESASRLNVNDTKRVIRALEIALCTGKPMSENGDEMRRREQNVTMIALNCDRQLLYDRINERVDRMFEAGLVQEVLSVGSFDYQSMQAIGYKEFKQLEFDAIDGKKQPNSESLTRVKELIKQHSRNYAKRQLTWFRRYDFAKWFDIGELDSALNYAKDVVFGKI